MEFIQIRYFYEAAMTENLSRAAERLHISQPSLTKSIKKLEEELGIELFDRVGHKIIINDNGRLFLNEITPLLTKLDDISDRMAFSAKKKRESVCIGVCGVSNLADAAIASFKKDNPGINVNVKCHIDLQEHIEITDYDMLLYSSSDERFKKYKGFKIAKDPLLLAVYKGHPLYDQKFYDVGELSGESFIVVRNGANHSKAMSLLMRQRLDVSDDISTDDIVKQMSLVKAGLGIAVAFKSECDLFGGNGMRFLTPAEKSLSREMMICFKREHLLSATGKALKASVEKAIVKMH